MNIFATDSNPELAARYLDDRRLPKMVVESAQILSSALYNLGYWRSDLYRETHRHHPCVKWAQSSRGNFSWLVSHGLALGKEYKFRFGATRDHRSVSVILNCSERFKDCPMDILGMTSFANATSLPKTGSVVQTYRRYMSEVKWASGATWRGRGMPDWHKKYLKQSEGVT